MKKRLLRSPKQLSPINPFSILAEDNSMKKLDPTFAGINASVSILTLSALAVLILAIH